MSRPLAVRAATVGCALALVLGGCTSDPGPDQPQTSAATDRTETATGDPTEVATPPTDEAVTKRALVGTRELEFAVGPVVNQGELSVLMLSVADVSPSPVGDPVAIHALWGGLRPGAYGVRLVDPRAQTVEETAQSEVDTLYTTGSLEVTAEPLALHAVFGAQSTPTVDVMLPYTGYVADVPVVEEAAAPAAAIDAFDELVGDPSAVTARVASLDSFAVSLDGATDTRVTAEQVEVNISADVLFAVDKADISSPADAALGRAVREFDSFPGGTLGVVGHTDDVGPDAYNQELSERRAQAVADRFAELTDTSRFEVVVEGRGESEPRAEGTTDADRALNRRVEVVFTPAAGGPAERPQQDEPAVSDPGEGPTAPGAEGVVLDGQQGQVRVTLDEVRRRDGLLVGEVAITQVSGEISAVGEWFAVGGADSHRGGFQPSLQYSPANLTLLAGDQRHFVLDYVRAGSEDSDDTWPLIDLTMSAPLPEGGTYVATAVWPDVSGGAPTVTLDVLNPSTEAVYRELRPPFRLTDVPVV